MNFLYFIYGLAYYDSEAGEDQVTFVKHIFESADQRRLKAIYLKDPDNVKKWDWYVYWFVRNLIYSKHGSGKCFDSRTPKLIFNGAVKVLTKLKLVPSDVASKTNFFEESRELTVEYSKYINIKKVNQKIV